jgi:hypothetical protein
VDVARNAVPVSRRGGGEAAFGFRTRIVLTSLAIGLLLILGAFALSSPMLMFMIPSVVFPVIAFGVLAFRDLWRPVPIAAAAVTEPPRFTWAEVRRSFARTRPREPLEPRTKIVWATAVAIYLASIVTYVLGGEIVKGAVVLCVLITGFVLAMARLFRR